MVRVAIFVEGKTEVSFINQVVTPVLDSSKIQLVPQTLITSPGRRKGKVNKGGAVSFGRLKDDAPNTLNQQSAPILSTFLDLYGLYTDFPGFEDAKKITDVYKRVDYLEDALHRAIVEASGCRPERFIPHIQPYEFEGLLFSDVKALCTIEPEWDRYRKELARIRNDYETPEHINGNYETKPSKRLEETLAPKYDKPLHGKLAAEKITLAVIGKECRHFRQWMEKLRGLA
uniref:DUF4276 family protein n=1 Tax=Candidatus Kentrum sp. TUN TaxID=2126343 RepID=A0A451A1B9_9GAMM|nr:MAG: protein of unknown function (DUF4276) [Candidatus Kentron sp. TUN]